MTEIEPQRLDGRTARRDKNRESVLDSMIDLIEAGNPSPTVAELSDRSGVSHRSVFRYFDDMDTLFRQAALRAYARYAPLSRIHRFGRGAFEDRVTALIDQRFVLFRVMVPLARSGRRRSGADDMMDSILVEYSAPMRDQLAAHFAAELDAMDPSLAGLALDVIEVTLSLDAYMFLLREGRSADEIAALYRTTLDRLLG